MSMIKRLKFTKMVASGNDFVVIDCSVIARRREVPTKQSWSNLARIICDRKFGAGADGMLILTKAGLGAIRMRIFNADGSEAQMCGNGARCVALYTGKKNIKINTLAGIIAAKVNAGSVKIRLPEPKAAKLDIPLKVNGRNVSVNFINTGVPHAAVFVEGIDKINVKDIGRQIRNHKKFFPAGTNVDFIEALSKNDVGIRTYERGVEDETLACGTGCVAAALIFALKTKVLNKINIHTRSGEVLKVYFKRDGARFSEVWLEGNARIVYKGEYLCLKAQ